MVSNYFDPFAYYVFDFNMRIVKNIILIDYLHCGLEKSRKIQQNLLSRSLSLSLVRLAHVKKVNVRNNGKCVQKNIFVVNVIRAWSVL